MWSYDFNISSTGACGQGGCLSPICNKEKIILLRTRTTHCGQLLSLSIILSLYNIVNVLCNTSQQNQSISNCDLSANVLLSTLIFLPSCSGAIKISWSGNGKYFFYVHSRYISDNTVNILLCFGFILRFCARFLSPYITLLQVGGKVCFVLVKRQNVMVEWATNILFFRFRNCSLVMRRSVLLMWRSYY
jgi:hypothetical protein